jgi:hypothetical protein
MGGPAARTSDESQTLDLQRNPSTVRRPRSSNRTTRSPGDNSSNQGKQGSLRKAAKKNLISDYPSAENTSGNSNNSGTGKLQSVKSNKTSGGNRANYRQRLGFQRKSTKAERQTGNALAAAADTTKPYMQPWMRYNRTESP